MRCAHRLLSLGSLARKKMQRDYRELGKLYNLVAHVIAFSKWTDLFLKLQKTKNIGIAAGKRQKLMLDSSIRQNAIYFIIRCALELKEALNTYVAQLHVSSNTLDKETFNQDYLTSQEQEALAIIKEQLKPLFRVTKGLEGNVNLKDSNCKASYRQLGELLLVFEFILGYFKKL